MRYFSDRDIKVKPPQGFTLIELLVVIAIIGLLASVVMASLNSARAKARNARRLADMTQIQRALELYYDTNGAYPIQTGWRGTTPNCYNTGADPNTAIPGLVPTYIPSMPQDPKPILPGNCYLYISDATGQNYKLIAYGTVENGALAPGAPSARYPSGCGAIEASYGIYTPAVACW